MVNAFVGDGALYCHEFAQRHERRCAAGQNGFRQCIGVAGAHAQRQQFLGAGPAGQWQLENDVHVLFLARDMKQIHRLAADGDAQRLGNRFGADAVERGLFLVNDEAHFGLVSFNIPVRVHHARGVMKNINDLLRQREAVFLRGTVNLGHGHTRIVFGGDGGDARTHAFGDVVALRLAFVLRYQIDLDISDIRAVPHEVVAHETVEIERRGDPGIYLVIGHLRFGADGRRNFACCFRGAFERAAFRHVQNDLKLALVVERQHFHLHPADADQRHGGEQKPGDACQKCVTPSRMRDERPHETAIQAGEEILFVFVGADVRRL